MTRRLLTPSFVTNLVIAVLLVGALIEIRNFGATARFVPSLFAWLTLILVAIDLMRQVAAVVLDHPAAAAGRTPRAVREKGNAGRAELMRVILFVLIFWIAVFFLGFNGAPFLLIGAYLTAEAGVRWHIAFAAALFGNLGIVWAMHGIGLAVWTGVLPSIVPGLVGGENWPIF